MTSRSLATARVTELNRLPVFFLTVFQTESSLAALMNSCPSHVNGDRLHLPLRLSFALISPLRA
jgi:hypothetical protein